MSSRNAALSNIDIFNRIGRNPTFQAMVNGMYARHLGHTSGQESETEPLDQISKFQDCAIVDQEPLSFRLAAIAATPHIVRINNALLMR